MNIYVGRLSRTTNEAKLRELFEQFGAVDKVNVIKDKFSGQPKGFAFVEMPDAQQAQDAIDALNGTDLEGQRLVVSQARPRENRPHRPGGFGGGRPRFNNNRY